MDLLTISCLTGFFGDMILQILIHLGFGGPTGWGLKDYFTQHGRFESMFIAAGMMTVFFILYDRLKIPVNYVNLAIYGIIVDIIFRKANLFPSLTGYYSNLNYFWSAVWSAIPMMLPLALSRIRI